MIKRCCNQKIILLHDIRLSNKIDYNDLTLYNKTNDGLQAVSILIKWKEELVMMIFTKTFKKIFLKKQITIVLP